MLATHSIVSAVSELLARPVSLYIMQYINVILYFLYEIQCSFSLEQADIVRQLYRNLYLSIIHVVHLYIYT